MCCSCPLSGAGQGAAHWPSGVYWSSSLVLGSANAHLLLDRRVACGDSWCGRKNFRLQTPFGNKEQHQFCINPNKPEMELGTSDVECAHKDVGWCPQLCIGSDFFKDSEDLHFWLTHDSARWCIIIKLVSSPWLLGLTSFVILALWKLSLEHRVYEFITC